MDFTLPADLWPSVVLLSLLCGAAGGLVWEVGNGVRRSSTEPATGLNNSLEFPRFRKGTEARSMLIELGFLGPTFVGAVAGLLVVLLIAPSSPNAEETAKALVAVGTATPQSTSAGGAATASKSKAQAPKAKAAAPTPAKATATVENNLTSKVGSTELVVLALLGGLGGWGLLQTLTTRMSSLMEAAVGKALQPAVSAGAEKVEKTAEDLNLSPKKQRKLVAAAEKGFSEAAESALREERFP